MRRSDTPRRLSTLLAMSAAMLAFVAITVNATPARAQLEPPASDAEGRCQTPRQALYTVLYWLQPERVDRAKAAACLDRTGLETPESDAAERAVALKLYLDVSAVWVRWEDVPDDPDYRNPSGEQRFLVHPDRIQGLEIVKLRGRWLFSQASVARVAPLVVKSSPAEAGREAGLRGAMPDWLRGDVFGIEAWQILGLMLLIILGVILRKLVIYVIVTYVRRMTRRLSVGWIDMITSKADKPVGTIVVAGVIAVGSPALDFPSQFAFIITIAIRSLAAYSVVWLCYRLVDVLSDILEERAAKTATKLDDQLVPLIRKSLKVFFVVVGAIFILQNLDVDVGSLLAGLGLGGLAFALAAKDTVANFFGSVMIFIDKPFQIGDWIKMSSDIEGTVEEVGFRTSRIRTFYNSIITVPNANVTNTAIDNLGARKYRRYRTLLSLTYDTPPERIEAFCEGLRGVLLATPGVRKDYFMVEFQDFGAHSLDVLLYCFFEVPDWGAELKTRTHVNLSILRLARSMGVSFAFPTQTLHIEHTPEHPLTARPGPSLAELPGVIASHGPGGSEVLPEAGYALSGRFTPVKTKPLDEDEAHARKAGG